MGLERNTNPVASSSFRGLNKKLSSISISSREATVMQNYILTQETLQVRNPFTLFTTSQFSEGGVAKPITGIAQCVLGTTTYQVVTGGTKIKSCSSSGALTDITGAVTITDSANNLMNFVKFKDGSANDILIGANGVDAPLKWTGTGNAALLGGTPPADFKYLIVHKNRLWGTSGEFIYHSDLLDGETWDSINWVYRFASQGKITNEITGIGVLGDNLVFFKEDAIAVLSGESFQDGYIQTIVVDGAISGFSVVPISSRRYGSILAFVNKNLEIKGFNGSKDLIHLSDPIDSFLNSYNKSRASYVSAINSNTLKQYICTISRANSQTHDTMIGYDYYLDGFDSDPEGKIPVESTCMPYYGIGANYLSTLTIDANENIYVGTYDGWVLQYDATAKKDIVRASEILNISTTGIEFTASTTTPHGLSVGDTVVISGNSVAAYNGSFTVSTVGSTTTFSCLLVSAVALGTGGIVKQTNDIRAIWQSKRHAFGNAALLKQLNDLDVVTVAPAIGQIKITVKTDRFSGEKTINAKKSGAIYGSTSLYGATSIYGVQGVAYNRVELTTNTGLTGITGRYFQFKIENVSGYIFGLEEYIMGITSHGYQAELEVA